MNNNDIDTLAGQVQALELLLLSLIRAQPYPVQQVATAEFKQAIVSARALWSAQGRSNDSLLAFNTKSHSLFTQIDR